MRSCARDRHSGALWLKPAVVGTTYMAQCRHHRQMELARTDRGRLVVRRLLLGHLGVELGDVDADTAGGDGLHLGRGVGLGHVLVGPDRMLREGGGRGGHCQLS